MPTAHLAHRCHGKRTSVAARGRSVGSREGRPARLASPGMETLERLGAGHLASAVVAYRDVLRTHQDLLNRLNVYPVPDGDTGTNMALTLESVVAELAAADGADLD